MNTTFLAAAAAITACVALVYLRNRSAAQAQPEPEEAFQGPALDPMAPENWDIGPVIRGENYSRNMPLHPIASTAGWEIDLFQDNQEVHYVTLPHGPLTDKRRLCLSFRIEAEPGARLAPVNYPDSPATLVLYLQRAGDDWTPSHEAFRWYAKFAQVIPLTVGEHAIEASLEGNWNAAQVSTRENNPAGFAMALANTARIGFVLGGGNGIGHGVRAIGGAVRIVVTSFRVE